MQTFAVSAGEYVPTADQRIVLHGIPWAEFEAFLHMKGSAPVPRIAYISGALELVSPSKDHERIKSWIGCLAEAFSDDVEIDLSPYGSWTLKDAPQEAGAEPDECYIAGARQDKDVPDLVIEVVWTSGGLDKLEICRRLGVGEFWQWRNGRIQIHLLRKGRYVLSRSSNVLPGLDMDLLVSCLDQPTRQRAVRAFREAILRRSRRAPMRRR